jgi:predicted transcriptional regulator
LITNQQLSQERFGRRKRTKYDLLADLLRSSKGGARKTNLMFRANLSFVLLNKYLSFLVENGFLESKDGLFFPTKTGLRYLHRYARYTRAKDDLIKSQERVVSSVNIAKGLPSN